jgi:hypothetical protein
MHISMFDFSQGCLFFLFALRRFFAFCFVFVCFSSALRAAPVALLLGIDLLGVFSTSARLRVDEQHAV